MGRKSMKTTKSGKFMNPTDQARKVARRKELKKNRKQRSTVRETVIRSKDVEDILIEIESIEKVEMESIRKKLPSEKGAKERKRKLLESLERLSRYWEKEDPVYYREIHTLMRNSELKRRQFMQTYEYSSSASDPQEAKDRLSKIPLPPESVPSASTDTLPENIPLPDPEPLIPPSILKNTPHSTVANINTSTEPPFRQLAAEKNKHLPRPPPGPPPGLPPSHLQKCRSILSEDTPTTKKRVTFTDNAVENPDHESEEPSDLTEVQSVNTLRQNLLKLAGITNAMEKVEALASNEALTQLDATPSTSSTTNNPLRPLSSLLAGSLMSQIPPGVRLPPGPPPGGPPPLMSPQILLSSNESSVILPPPGTTSINPVNSATPLVVPPVLEPHIQASAVLTAPPKKLFLHPLRDYAQARESSGEVISAKPQIINKLADVTKMVPTSLRVKRDNICNKPTNIIPVVSVSNPTQQSLNATNTNNFIAARTLLDTSSQKSASLQVKTQDDAYDDFMKEMQNLL